MAVNRPVPDIAVVAVAEDAAIDQALRDFLRAAGLPLADDGPADGRTMAELSDDEKDAISHRGRAARAFAEWLNR